MPGSPGSPQLTDEQTRCFRLPEPRHQSGLFGSEQNYDGGHLSMAGYFATVERVIPVDDHHASMLARWNPGQTFWFTDAVTLDDTPVVWCDRGEQDWWPCPDKL